MANYKKKTVEEEAVVEEVVEVEVNPIIKEKKFENDDMIACQSVTVGGLYIEGIKSKDLYEFTSFGDIVEISYEDLMAFLRKKDSLMFYPNYIVLDKDFVKQNPILEEFYNSQYTQEDFNTILSYDTQTMEKNINMLPAGVKEAFKGYVMGQIESGELDSVKKIKLIDSIFDTQMLLRMTQQ